LVEPYFPSHTAVEIFSEIAYLIDPMVGEPSHLAGVVAPWRHEEE
jgi:hypothetical protein